MSISRRCPSCDTWTKDNDYCAHCNKLLDFDKIKALERSKKQAVIDSLPPDKIDIFLKKFKNSRYLLIRIIYYILYSVWFILTAIISFFMFLIAVGPS